MDREAPKNETEAAPSELTGTLPRKVRLNSSSDSRYLPVVVLFFFAGGLIFLGWIGFDGVRQFQGRAALHNDGRVVVGEVTGFTFGRNTPMGVNYRFTVNGVTYSGEAKEPNSPRPGTALDKGDKILIRFLPFNPAINHPDAWEWSADIGWYFIAGQIFFTAIGGLTFAVLWADRRLAREGRAAAGEVTRCTPDDRRFNVEYEFRTADGLLMKGKNDCPDEYGAGARVWILYLPQRPRRNHIYPLQYFDIVE